LNEQEMAEIGRGPEGAANNGNGGNGHMIAIATPNQLPVVLGGEQLQPVASNGYSCSRTNK
jgi:hypothetical protein